MLRGMTPSEDCWILNAIPAHYMRKTRTLYVTIRKCSYKRHTQVGVTYEWIIRNQSIRTQEMRVMRQQCVWWDEKIEFWKQNNTVLDALIRQILPPKLPVMNSCRLEKRLCHVEHVITCCNDLWRGVKHIHRCNLLNPQQGKNLKEGIFIRHEKDTKTFWSNAKHKDLIFGTLNSQDLEVLAGGRGTRQSH